MQTLCPPCPAQTPVAGRPTEADPAPAPEPPVPPRLLGSGKPGCPEWEWPPAPGITGDPDLPGAGRGVTVGVGLGFGLTVGVGAGA